MPMQSAAGGWVAFRALSRQCGPSRPSLRDVIVDRIDIGAAEFQEATGWEIKPEGACKAGVCVALAEGGFDLLATAERLGMAVVSEPGLWAVGPETIAGRALTTADASDFHLPDLDGGEFHIDSLRGRKVLLVCWAPY
jgi:hypothetical protein